MKVVSVINYKGGVGKTTLTANIAAELAFRGKKVLVLDLDPQANLTFSFVKVDDWERNLQSQFTIKSWYDAFIEREEIIDLKNLSVRPPIVNGFTRQGALNIICSHLGLINVDLELAVMLGGASPRQVRNNYLKVYSLLSQGISALSEENAYDLLLIDCPPNFNIVTKNALVASDYYVVPAKPDYLSTLGIDQLSRHVKELVQDYNTYAAQLPDEYDEISPQLLGIVFTMVSVRNGDLISAQQQYVSQIQRLSLSSFNAKIRENKTVYADAPEYGVPVVLQRLSGNTYLSIRQELESLTDEFIRKVGL